MIHGEVFSAAFVFIRTVTGKMTRLTAPIAISLLTVVFLEGTVTHEMALLATSVADDLLVLASFSLPTIVRAWIPRLGAVSSQVTSFTAVVACSSASVLHFTTLSWASFLWTLTCNVPSLATVVTRHATLLPIVASRWPSLRITTGGLSTITVVETIATVTAITTV